MIDWTPVWTAAVAGGAGVSGGVLAAGVMGRNARDLAREERAANLAGRERERLLEAVREMLGATQDFRAESDLRSLVPIETAEQRDEANARVQAFRSRLDAAFVDMHLATRSTRTLDALRELDTAVAQAMPLFGEQEVAGSPAEAAMRHLSVKRMNFRNAARSELGVEFDDASAQPENQRQA